MNIDNWNEFASTLFDVDSDRDITYDIKRMVIHTHIYIS